MWCVARDVVRGAALFIVSLSYSGQVDVSPPFVRPFTSHNDMRATALPAFIPLSVITVVLPFTLFIPTPHARSC